MTSGEVDGEALIWSCQTEMLAKMPPINPTSWPGAVQLDILNPTGISPIAPSRGEADLKIAAVMMVKDEADIITSNLEWLYFLGIRRFVIIDNNSHDGTSDLLLAFRHGFQDAEVLVVSDPIVRLIQSEKTTGACQFAVNVWSSCEWIFPIDADEFLIPQKGFQPLHDLDAQFDAILISKVNHFIQKSEDTEDDASSSHFRRMPLRTGKWALPPKIALRAKSVYQVSQGNHKVLRTDGVTPCYAPAGQGDMFYREYQVRSYRHFRLKVTNGGKAIREAMAATGKHLGGAHWLNWYELYLAGGDQALRAIYERDFQRSLDDGLVLDPFEPANAR